MNSSDSSSLKSNEGSIKLSNGSLLGSQEKLILPRISLNKSNAASVASLSKRMKSKTSEEGGTTIEKNFSFGKNLEKGRKVIHFDLD